MCVCHGWDFLGFMLQFLRCPSDFHHAELDGAIRSSVSRYSARDSSSKFSCFCISLWAGFVCWTVVMSKHVITHECSQVKKHRLTKSWEVCHSQRGPYLKSINFHLKFAPLRNEGIVKAGSRVITKALCIRLSMMLKWTVNASDLVNLPKVLESYKDQGNFHDYLCPA